MNDFLKTHPGEKENSIGIVGRDLTPDHMEAAVWMHDNRQMVLDAYNLHNLIVNYEHCKGLAGIAKAAGASGADQVMFAGETIAPGEFNPQHLVQWWLQQKRAQ